MRTKAGKQGRAQARKQTRPASDGIRQVLLPLVAGVIATKHELTTFVHGLGLKALDAILEAEAEQLVGRKGGHQVERRHNHWGAATAELAFGGRRVAVRRPRVRSTDGHEVELPSVRHFREVDPLPERVVDQILLGVSTRGYERSLDRPPPDVRTRGASKSAASRHLVERTRAGVQEWLKESLAGVELAALLVDGLGVAGHTIVVALGITVEGAKVPLALRLGSTENATICTELLQDALGRGLTIQGRLLCVIDGGKGIRKALADVLGDSAVVQRCQVHKKRNVLEHLGPSRQHHVGRLLAEAYNSGSAKLARQRLQSLASWLDRNGHTDAAGSLREGLEETLTVLKLGLTGALRRSLSTTNAIENLMGAIRRVTRNVKRWRDGGMAKRWAAFAIHAARARFHRIKGHDALPALMRALRGDGAASAAAPALDRKEQAA